MLHYIRCIHILQKDIPKFLARLRQEKMTREMMQESNLTEREMDAITAALQSEENTLESTFLVIYDLSDNETSNKSDGNQALEIEPKASTKKSPRASY